MEHSIASTAWRTRTPQRLLHRIELRARDYIVSEIGPSKWIRWGRLVGLVEAGAIHGYWSAEMVQRVGDAAWHRASPRRIVTMLAKASADERRTPLTPERRTQNCSDGGDL